MEYAYSIIEFSTQEKEIKFTSPVPLRRGEQIEVSHALYEVAMIRYICASYREVKPDEGCKVNKDEYKTIYIQAHVIKLK